MPGEKTRGYVLGAVAAASYGLNPLFALPLYGAGLGPDSVLFYRYLLAVVMLGSLMIFRRQSFALTRRDILPLAVMGLLFSFSSLCLFASYNYMDAGIASTILFLYPVMVAVIMSACFGERVTASTVLSILLALGGIALLYKGGDGATLSLAGVALVFLSSLCYAVYIVGVEPMRRMAPAIVTSETIVGNSASETALIQSSGEGIICKPATPRRRTR